MSIRLEEYVKDNLVKVVVELTLKLSALEKRIDRTGAKENIELLPQNRALKKGIKMNVDTYPTWMTKGVEK